MYICKDSVFDPVCDLCRYCIHGRMSLINRNLTGNILDEENRHKRTFIKNFCTHYSFELELFDIGAFLQYATYTVILYFGNGYLSTHGIRNDYIGKQKRIWYMFLKKCF